MCEFSIDDELPEIQTFAKKVADIVRKDADLSEDQTRALEMSVQAVEAFPRPACIKECEYGVVAHGSSHEDGNTHALTIQVRRNGLDLFMNGTIEGKHGSDTYVRTGFHAGPEANFAGAAPTVYPAANFLEEALDYVLNRGGKGYFA